MANIPLKSIKFPDLADTYTVPSNAGELPYNKSATYPADTVGKALQDKPDADGVYPDMTVGNAEQLVSNVFVEDKVPYQFRTAGGSVDIGKRAYFDAIVGGTVAWNQLVLDANKDFTNGESTDTRTGFYLAIQTTGSPVQSPLTDIISTAKKYNKIFKATGVTSSGIRIKHNGSARDLILYQNSDLSMVSGHIYLYSANFVGVDVSTADGVSVKNNQLYDLTQMFGSTIADYIYSLEQATAGAGVAFFRKYFPNSYYEYNAGELVSVNGLSAHKTTGFNQWDEEWANRGYNTTTGEYYNDNSLVGCKNYIPILPNTSYCIGKSLIGSDNVVGIFVLYYDADKNFLVGQNAIIYTNWGDANFVKTTPSNAHYMRFFLTATYGTTYKNDICINLHWDGSRDGEYEEYKEHTYPLDDSLTLRGIPKLDASNKLYFDGDTYEPDGTVNRRYEERAYQSGDESLADAITDGTKTVVKKATPTTETADPYNGIQIVDDFGTEEFVTTAIIPVGHVTHYPIDALAKLEMMPNSPSGNGEYIVTQSGGVNEYTTLASSSIIENIINRLEALENA